MCKAADYVKTLIEPFIFYPAESYDIKGKQLLKQNRKFSFVDPGLRRHLIPRRNFDLDHSLENMRREVKSAATVLCLATTLHSNAVGNMTPSYRVMPDGNIREVYFYCVDISEFTANKLSDRGSLSAIGIVTNVQDFIVTLSKGLGL